MKEQIKTESYISGIKEDISNHRGLIVRIFLWLFILTVIMFVYFFVMVYNHNVSQHYRNDNVEFCKHYNMDYYQVVTPSGQYNIHTCISTNDDTINDSRVIVLVNNKWMFKDETQIKI
jgi:hypothetical protein